MMELPLDPAISLDDTIAFHRALIHSAASIVEINCVRKHFSAVKGGRLAIAARAAACALSLRLRRSRRPPRRPRAPAPPCPTPLHWKTAAPCWLATICSRACPLPCNDSSSIRPSPRRRSPASSRPAPSRCWMATAWPKPRAARPSSLASTPSSITPATTGTAAPPPTISLPASAALRQESRARMPHLGWRGHCLNS